MNKIATILFYAMIILVTSIAVYWLIITIFFTDRLVWTTHNWFSYGERNDICFTWCYR